MELQKKQSGNTTVLAISGRIDSNSAKDFETALLPEIENQRIGVVIDLGSLDYISSAGLRVFLVAAKMAKRAGIKFVLCALNEEIDEVFQMTGFKTFMTIEATLEAGLANFQER